MIKLNHTEFDSVIAKYANYPSKVNSNTKLFIDLELDSFDMLALICQIEEAFGLTVDLTHEATVESVDDLYRYVCSNSKFD